ncbi:MAG: hypothetical protein ACK47B_23880 [Armatimonadota bacterium]
MSVTTRIYGYPLGLPECDKLVDYFCFQADDGEVLPCEPGEEKHDYKVVVTTPPVKLTFPLEPDVPVTVKQFHRRRLRGPAGLTKEGVVWLAQRLNEAV